jgi:hypothetical protein
MRGEAEGDAVGDAVGDAGAGASRGDLYPAHGRFCVLGAEVSDNEESPSQPSGDSSKIASVSLSDSGRRY